MPTVSMCGGCGVFVAVAGIGKGVGRCEGQGWRHTGCRRIGSGIRRTRSESRCQCIGTGRGERIGRSVAPV